MKFLKRKRKKTSLNNIYARSDIKLYKYKYIVLKSCKMYLKKYIII